MSKEPKEHEHKAPEPTGDPKPNPADMPSINEPPGSNVHPEPPPEEGGETGGEAERHRKHPDKTDPNDPDDLEDEIDQSVDDGDVTRGRKKKR